MTPAAALDQGPGPAIASSGNDLMHRNKEACYRALSTRDARFDGRFLVAVKTTGVYCRPVCPAQTPKFEHVLFMPTAAAAQEAGFRPCLRCRPETSPDLAAWHGTSNTVSRAMALIEAGVLNNESVDGLASRLDVGERQLRRLFRQHIGASPKSVAQTRRVHLAKQLITDTQLPLVEVAFAAGFGSVRRFNDTFHKLYGRPPRTLRRSGADEVPGSTLTLRLPYKPPYDWAAMIGFLGARAIPGIEHVQGDTYERTISFGDGHGRIAIRHAASGKPPHALVADIEFPVISALPKIIGRIRSIFDLGADPVAIAGTLALDPVLAKLVSARPGLRLLGAWDGFELAVRTILGEETAGDCAAHLTGRLTAALGSALQPSSGFADRALASVFPKPETLVFAEPIIEAGIASAPAEAISRLARAVHDDPAFLDPNHGLEFAISRLIDVVGVGEGAAHYIAMRALHEPDAFPLAHGRHLPVISSRIGRLSSSDLIDRAEVWRPWRAYAAFHLWTGDPTIDCAKGQAR
jgi:AraC family transcriptional regulator of adaptative response / DNA-3-methyladenine glycosylase II